MDEKEILELCDRVRQTTFDLYAYLRPGHLEKVYENGLAHRLRKMELKVDQQHPLKVYDEDSTLPGDYFADMLIESKLIIERKAGKALAT